LEGAFHTVIKEVAASDEKGIAEAEDDLKVAMLENKTKNREQMPSL
jgi:hypothetical protein